MDFHAFNMYTMQPEPIYTNNNDNIANIKYLKCTRKFLRFVCKTCMLHIVITMSADRDTLERQHSVKHA